MQYRDHRRIQFHLVEKSPVSDNVAGVEGGLAIPARVRVSHPEDPGLGWIVAVAGAVKLDSSLEGPGHVGCKEFLSEKMHAKTARSCLQ